MSMTEASSTVPQGDCQPDHKRRRRDLSWQVVETDPFGKGGWILYGSGPDVPGARHLVQDAETGRIIDITDETPQAGM